MRASAVCEESGVPVASLVCEGFLGQAAAVSVGMGMPNMQLAMIPGHLGVQTREEVKRNVLAVTVDRIIDNLIGKPEAGSIDDEPSATEVFYRGDFDAVNRYFCEQELSDGLPVVPPTRERIASFLSYTDRDPNESLGIMQPDNRSATIWSVAVNGVMSGCRPEYMPILVALIEAMVDSDYGVEHSGNTPGGETLIILNGPIIKELGFNYTQGVMRDGFVPNTAIGRFWRLYLRNVAGFHLHKNDKCTFGNTWRVVVAENEDVMRRINWEPNSVEMGFAAGDNTVTISRYTGGSFLAAMSGDVRENMLPYLVNGVVGQISWHIMFTVGQGMGTLRPLVLLTPILAETFAKAGWSKSDIKRHLFEHARIPAHQFERILRDWTLKYTWSLKDETRLGHIPRVFYESDDPNRLVPLVWKPEDYMIVVTGDPLRNSAYVFAHNGLLGYPVAKRIHLPEDWRCRIATVASKQ